MTSDPDPTSSTFLDEKSVRDELTRVFDVCSGCRRCTDFCGSFTTLFDLIEPHRDAGRLAPSQQDEVIDRCFQCDACVAVCPYTPDRHELAIDVPKLLIRSLAMRTSVGQRSWRERRSAAVLGRPDLVGRIGTRWPSAANALVGARAGSSRRRLLSVVTGVTSNRRLPTFATQRFSRWFRSRSGGSVGGTSRVVVYSTCLVEYGDADIGRDLVALSERNGVECVLSAAGCCGAAALHAGDIDRFAALATRAVTVLAHEIRLHGSVSVPQATCAAALRRHALDHVAATARSDAEFVATQLAEPPVFVAAQSPALAGRSVVHVEQAAGSGAVACDLLTAAAADVETTRVGTGITSTWGLRGSNDDTVASQGRRNSEQLRFRGDAATGDDLLANQAVFDQTGTLLVHPFQLVARGLDGPVERDA